MATVAGAILLCGGLVWLQGIQREARNEVREAISHVQNARVELARGFLEQHLSPVPDMADHPGIRLALLDQAATSLAEARRHLERRVPLGSSPPEAGALSAALAGQHDRVRRFRVAVAPRDSLAPALHAEYREISRGAELLSAQLAAALTAQWRRQGRIGVLVLSCALLLLVVAGVGLHISSLWRLRAEAEVNDYRQHLEELVQQRSAALAASEGRLRAFIDALPDVAFVLDGQGRYVEILTPGSPLLYRPAAELKGRRLDEIFPAEIANRFQAVVHAALHRGEMQALEYALPLAQGERWFEGRCVPVDPADGMEPCVVFIGRDVTGPHRAHRLQRVVHECTRVLAGPDGADYCMREILQTVGSALGWQVGEVWRLGSGDALECLFQWHAANQRPDAFAQRTGALTFERGVGLPGMAWARHKPVWMADVTQDPSFLRAREAGACDLHAGFAVPIELGGRMAGALAFFRREPGPREDDLLLAMESLASQVGQYLDRKAAEARVLDAKAATECANQALAGKAAELQEALVRLQHMENLRDSLVHMIAHDMRSPLQGISGFIQMAIDAARGRVSPRVVEDLQFALHGTSTLTRMVGSMLDVSRLEAGCMPLDLKRVDLHICIQDALSSLGSLPSSHLVVVDPSPVDAAATCDRDVVTRVIANLVGNALKFSPAGSRIEVGIDAADGTLRLRVRDQGPGVPEADRLTIFEKFCQSHATKTTRQSSSGLGLTFCKLAIEAHAGQIGVESAPGGGSRFWFTLPRADAPPATRAAP